MIFECKNSIYLLYMRKLSLLHETPRPETETFDLSSGRDRDVSRPSLDRDVEMETRSLKISTQSDANNNTLLVCY